MTASELTAEEIERALPEGCRYSLASSREGRVCADAGDGHTLNALRRRGLVPDELDPTWDRGSWWQRLTPLGVEVAGLAATSTRVGGWRGKRGPCSWRTRGRA